MGLIPLITNQPNLDKQKNNALTGLVSGRLLLRHKHMSNCCCISSFRMYLNFVVLLLFQAHSCRTFFLFLLELVYIYRQALEQTNMCLVYRTEETQIKKLVCQKILNEKDNYDEELIKKMCSIQCLISSFVCPTALGICKRLCPLSILNGFSS